MYELEVGVSGRQSSEWRPTNCRISQLDPSSNTQRGNSRSPRGAKTRPMGEDELFEGGEEDFGWEGGAW